jgi:hypothetical protein
MKRQLDLLNSRYDLSERPAAGVTISRGEGHPGGFRIKLSRGAPPGKL